MTRWSLATTLLLTSVAVNDAFLIIENTKVRCPVALRTRHSIPALGMSTYMDSLSKIETDHESVESVASVSGGSAYSGHPFGGSSSYSASHLQKETKPLVAQAQTEISHAVQTDSPPKPISAPSGSYLEYMNARSQPAHTTTPSTPDSTQIKNPSPSTPDSIQPKTELKSKDVVQTELPETAEVPQAAGSMPSIGSYMDNLSSNTVEREPPRAESHQPFGSYMDNLSSNAAETKTSEPPRAGSHQAFGSYMDNLSSNAIEAKPSDSPRVESHQPFGSYMDNLSSNAVETKTSEPSQVESNPPIGSSSPPEIVESKAESDDPPQSAEVIEQPMEPLFKDIPSSAIEDLGQQILDNIATEKESSNNVHEEASTTEKEINSTLETESSELTPPADQTVYDESSELTPKEHLFQRIDSTLSSVFGPDVSHNYRTTKEQMGEYRTKNAKRLQRSTLAKDKSAEKIKKIMAKAEKDIREVEKDLEIRLNAIQLSLNDANDRIEVLLFSQLAMEADRERKIESLISSLQEAIQDQEVHIKEEDMAVVEMMDIYSSISSNDLIQNLDMMIEQKKQLVDVERTQLGDLRDSLEVAHGYLSQSKDRASAIQGALKDLGPLKVTDDGEVAYDDSKFEKLEQMWDVAAESAIIDIEKVSVFLRDFETMESIKESLMNVEENNGEENAVTDQNVMNGEVKSEAITEIQEITEQGLHHSPHEIQMLPDQDLEFKNKSELWSIVASSLGNAAVDSAKAGVFGIKAVAKKIKKENTEEEELQHASHALKESSNELGNAFKAITELGKSSFEQMTEQISEQMTKNIQ